MSSNDLIQINFDDAIDDFDEDIVNLALTMFIELTYTELKTKMPIFYQEKNYKEIFAHVHKFKSSSRYFGATNFSNLCNDMQHCCLEGKINAEKLDELYPIFINNLDNLYNECKKIYYAKIEKNNNNNNNDSKKLLMQNKKDDDNNDNNNNNFVKKKSAEISNEINNDEKIEKIEKSESSDKVENKKNNIKIIDNDNKEKIENNNKNNENNVKNNNNEKKDEINNNKIIENQNENKKNDENNKIEQIKNKENNKIEENNKNENNKNENNKNENNKNENNKNENNKNENNKNEINKNENNKNENNKNENNYFKINILKETENQENNTENKQKIEKITTNKNNLLSTSPQKKKGKTILKFSNLMKTMQLEDNLSKISIIKTKVNPNTTNSDFKPSSSDDITSSIQPNIFNISPENIKLNSFHFKIEEYEQDIEKYTKEFKSNIKKKDIKKLLNTTISFKDNIIMKYGFYKLGKNFEEIIQKFNIYITNNINKIIFNELIISYEDIETLTNNMYLEIQRSLKKIYHISNFTNINFKNNDEILNELKPFKTNFISKNEKSTKNKKIDRLINKIDESNDNNYFNNNTNDNNILDIYSLNDIKHKKFKNRINYSFIDSEYPFKEDEIITNCLIF